MVYIDMRIDDEFHENERYLKRSIYEFSTAIILKDLDFSRELIFEQGLKMIESIKNL